MTLAELSLASWAMVAGVMIIGGLVHGTLGLGFPLVTTPLLALHFDVRTAILITLLPTVTVNCASILRGGRWGDSIGTFWPLAVFAVFGSAVGAYVLTRSDPAPFKLLLASLIVLYLLTHWLGTLKLHWAHSHLSLSMVIFGLIAGFAAGTTNVMVPILIIYTLELGLGRTAMVQVFNLCFLGGKLAQIGVFGAAGLLGTGLLLATLPLAVIGLLTLLTGMSIRDRIPSESYRRIVRAVLLVLAILLIAQYALSP